MKLFSDFSSWVLAAYIAVPMAIILAVLNPAHEKYEPFISFVTTIPAFAFFLHMNILPIIQYMRDETMLVGYFSASFEKHKKVTRRIVAAIELLMVVWMYSLFLGFLD